MTRNAPSSQASRPRLAQKCQHQGNGQHYVRGGYDTSASAYSYSDAPTTALSPQSQSTNPRYSQHLDFVPSASHFATQSHPYPPQNDSHFATHRPWSHTNPNALDLNSYPAFNFDQAASPPTKHYHPASYAHQPTAYTQQKQLTEAQLTALNATSPPTDGRQRFERQGQRVGPWDGVGYVGSERVER
ncbi:hypothetical protein B5807_06285 [Epicoccum nigrum]|uniref:Uncharacterized protein n=1 Tax=Epicoccum nigrum TaxID=105696 RepID=A0A1Y2M3Z3_EPING|nr:hypothetical protein B5807_06285 [Epicoccum nigrum]